MTSKRIIPLFLLRGKRLAKGTRFGNFVDVGDPISQGMIYDAQGADEIIMVDIEASNDGRVIEPGVIKQVIEKCRLPIAAGGGIKNVADAKKCFESGADKIIVNTQAVLNPFIVRKLADEFGSQSVVVSIDVKKNRSGNYDIYVYSGRQKVGINLFKLIETIIKYGAGEIMVTAIEKEGTLSGFDYDLYSELRNFVSVPFIASGGAGNYGDIVRLFREADCDACTIGKMLFLRDYDIVRIKSYLKGEKIPVRES